MADNHRLVPVRRPPVPQRSLILAVVWCGLGKGTRPSGQPENGAPRWPRLPSHPTLPRTQTLPRRGVGRCRRGRGIRDRRRLPPSGDGKVGWNSCNLRTQFERIVTRAGLEKWPRLFHNMRASRETELVEQFPEHIAAAWIGNTVQVARRHCLQVTEEAIRQAVQIPVQSAHDSPGHASPKKGQTPVFPEKNGGLSLDGQ